MDIETVNEFIDWIQFKMALEFQARIKSYPRKKEIWWVSLGKNIGVEIQGKNARFERPVLVIKAFNTESFMVAPLSSKIRDNEYLFKFENSSGEQNAVVLSQLRTVSIKRFLRKVDTIPDIDFDGAVERLINILNKTKTPQGGAFSELPEGEPNRPMISAEEQKSNY